MYILTVNICRASKTRGTLEPSVCLRPLLYARAISCRDTRLMLLTLHGDAQYAFKLVYAMRRRGTLIELRNNIDRYLRNVTYLDLRL